jgi:5-methylcytosine-specific restriction protein A
MEWRGGNRQLRDHAELGKDVHVFEETPRPTRGLRYRGQFACAGYYERDDVPDTAGEPRRAFVFLLVPIEDIEETHTGAAAAPTNEVSTLRGAWEMPMEDLRELARAELGRQPKSREGKRRVWERSERLKIYVRRRASGTCEGCGMAASFNDRNQHPYLEPHHTRRLSDGGPDDPRHVIALCPGCHRRVHFGIDGDAYNELLIQRIAMLENVGAPAA